MYWDNYKGQSSSSRKWDEIKNNKTKPNEGENVFLCSCK
jgi:hypothetical protein